MLEAFTIVTLTGSLEIRTSSSQRNFNYYNPQVLRAYRKPVPTKKHCRVWARSEHLLIESENAEEVLQFSRLQSGVKLCVIPLTDPAQ